MYATSLTKKTLLVPADESKRIHPPAVPSSKYDATTTTTTKLPGMVTRRATNVADARAATSLDVSSTHLGSKLCGDVLVAVAVTFGVSPFLTVVDKAIVESAAGTNSLIASGFNSLRYMVRNPVEYLKSPTFLLMWGVYSATYATANSFKTFEEHATYRRARSSSSAYLSQPSGNQSAGGGGNGMFKAGAFLGTTFVNSGASMLKDRAYARMFSGGTSVGSSFPRSTYALWMMRDFSVIGSSFLLPDIVSSKLVEDHGMDRERAQSLCQLGIPVAAQFVAGPFQYLGLDMYNRNLSSMTTTQAAADRVRQLYKGVGPVIAARIGRIVPGYSIGGVANTKLRAAWRENLLRRDVEAMMKTATGVSDGGNSAKSGNSYSASRLVELLHGGSTWNV